MSVIIIQEIIGSRFRPNFGVKLEAKCTVWHWIDWIMEEHVS